VSNISNLQKPSLPFLEIMVIRTCNISCEGCTTFSDLKYNGYVPWSQGQAWIQPWINRLDIQAVGLMGGEPLINPELEQWLRGLRSLLPSAQIRFVTNGLLLEKHWHIVELLQELGNTVLKISAHVDDEKIDCVVDRIFSTWTWQPVEEFGIKRWGRNNDLRFQIARPEIFIKTFQGEYHTMQPHNNVPSEAFDICVQKRCPLLYQGRIYKCGTAGLTPELLQRFEWPNKDLWSSYIDSGLSNDCADKNLQDFVNNFGKPHSMCAQCPSAKDFHSRIDHKTTVTFKKLDHV
jgi:organic radical activating enzyme